LLIRINDEEIVLENLYPLSDATAKALQLYRKIVRNTFAILIQTLAPEILAGCPLRLSHDELWIHLCSLYYQENTFTFYN
jgi:hypothetical protein